MYQGASEKGLAVLNFKFEIMATMGVIGLAWLGEETSDSGDGCHQFPDHWPPSLDLVNT